jgi:hypothetical protein
MNTPITIQTYARNISAGFFEKLGFIPKTNKRTSGTSIFCTA